MWLKAATTRPTSSPLPTGSHCPAQHVHRVHAPRQPLERPKRAPQQEGVSRERDHEPSDDDQRLRCPDRRIDLDRADEQKHCDPAEQPRVHREDSPEERHTHQLTLAPASVSWRALLDGPRRHEQDGHRGCALEMLRESALRTAAQARSCGSAHHDHVGGLLGGDLAEQRGGVAHSRTVLSAIGQPVLRGQSRDEAGRSLPLTCPRDTLVGARSVGNVRQDQPQLQPVAEVGSRLQGGTAVGAVTNPAQNRSSHRSPSSRAWTQSRVHGAGSPSGEHRISTSSRSRPAGADGRVPRRNAAEAP